jgi:hypothetical protein
MLGKPLAPLLHPIARGRQLIRDLLVLQAIISKHDGCRPQGYSLLCLPRSEHRFERLPLFPTQLYRLWWT